MKKSLKVSIIALVFAVAFSFYAETAPKRLIVGVTADYSPFVYIERGKIVGFDIDLIKRITKHLNYEVKIKDMEFEDLFSALKNKEIDVAISAISVTKKRKKQVYFSSKYYFPRFTMLSNRDSRIDSISKLKGKIVAAVSGTIMENFLVTKFAPGKQIKIKIFTNRNHMLNALLKGKIDASLTEDGWAKTRAKIYKNLSYIIIDTPPSKGYAIAFQKNSSLIDGFNDEIVEIKASAQLRKLKKKWGLI
jgi:arginine/lysine/histidine transporter system substrate-binding protein